MFIKLLSYINSSILTKQHWYKLLIVLSVLAVNLLLSFKLSDKYLLLFLAVLLGIVVLLIVLRCPPLGILILIFSALAVPLGVNTGTQTRVNAAILMLVLLIGIWLIGIMVHAARLDLKSRPVIPLILLMAATIISFGFGQLPFFDYAPHAPILSQLGGVAIYLFSGTAFLLAGNVISNTIWLKRMTWVFLVLATIYIIFRFFPALNIITGNFYVGGLFWTWLTALSFSQAMYNNNLHIFWRIALLVILGLEFVLSLVMNRIWYSGWLPGIVVLFVILLIGSPRYAKYVILGGVLFAILGYHTLQDITSTLFSEKSYDLLTRTAAWSVLGEIIKVSPIFGFGPANYYFFTPYFNILGYNVRFNSHNNYVDLVAQTGVVGLGIFIWFAAEVGFLGWRLLKKVPVGFEKAYVIGIIGGLVGTLTAGMLGDWFLPFVYNIGFEGFRSSVLFWIFLGGLLVLDRVTNSRNPD